MDEDILESALLMGLQSRGVDVITSKQAGMLNRDDEEHLAFATGLGRTLVSYNNHDYLRIHAEWVSTGKSHAGIVGIHQRVYALGEEIRMLSRFALATRIGTMQDQFVFLRNWATTN